MQWNTIELSLDLSLECVRRIGNRQKGSIDSIIDNPKQKGELRLDSWILNM